MRAGVRVGRPSLRRARFLFHSLSTLPPFLPCSPRCSVCALTRAPGEAELGHGWLPRISTVALRHGRLHG